MILQGNFLVSFRSLAGEHTKRLKTGAMDVKQNVTVSCDTDSCLCPYGNRCVHGHFVTNENILCVVHICIDAINFDGRIGACARAHTLRKCVLN